MIRVHFIGLHPDRPVTPLPSALGLGNRTLDNLASGNRYAGLHQNAHSLFVSVPIEDAQIAVYPHEYFNNEETAEVARRAEAAGLPMVFFRQSDNTEASSPPYGLVFRDSMLASRQTEAEAAMPAFCDDPLVKRGSAVTPLPKPALPEIAFCGYVGAPGMLAGYLLVGRGRKVVGLALRRKAISVLQDSPLVRTKFIERYQYWGGAIKLWDRRIQMLKNRFLRRRGKDVGPERDMDITERVYNEFIDNLIGSPYNLCIRGAGNFTYRFYETLAAGRIPLFIDTECVLPFSHRINWQKHCVWINVNELRDMPQAIVRFHDSLTADEFKQLQIDNRKLWQDWLTPEAFYYRVLEEVIFGESQPPTEAEAENVSGK